MNCVYLGVSLQDSKRDYEYSVEMELLAAIPYLVNA